MGAGIGLRTSASSSSLSEMIIHVFLHGAPGQTVPNRFRAGGVGIGEDGGEDLYIPHKNNNNNHNNKSSRKIYMLVKWREVFECM